MSGKIATLREKRMVESSKMAKQMVMDNEGR